MTAKPKALFVCILIAVLVKISASAEMGEEDASDDCEIDIHRDLALNEPLVLTDASPARFLYPKPATPTRLRLDDGEHFRLVCGLANIHVNCHDRNLYFDGMSQRFYMAQLGCRVENRPLIKKALEGSCPSNVECWQIGIQVNLFDFLPTIDLIYMNPGRKRPLWAHVVIPSIIFHQQHRGESLTFQVTEQFSGLQEVFDVDYQIARFTTVLGSADLANRYITRQGPTIFQPGEWLVLGLLIANDDFFYKPQQDTVHFFENAVPTWKSVAENNWAYSGSVVRKVATDTRSDFDMWSGSIGTLQLRDAKGTNREIYLKGEVMPVPRLLFRQVYDRSHNRGVVFVVLNNPFAKGLAKDDKLCPERPICPTLHPQFQLFQIGYTYCCSLKDFAPVARRRGLPAFPDALPLL